MPLILLHQSSKIYSMTFQGVGEKQLTKCQTSLPSPSRYSTQTHAPHKVSWVWRELLYLIFLLRSRLLCTMQRWSSCWDSFREHMAIQSTTSHPSVDYGLAWVHDSDGMLREDTRTLARAQYTRCLLDLRERADLVDLQTFLMGFDAGEQWASRIEDTQTYNAPQIPAWLLLANEKVDQVIRVYRGQIPDAIPAAIAADTTNDARTRHN